MYYFYSFPGWLKVNRMAIDYIGLAGIVILKLEETFRFDDKIDDILSGYGVMIDLWLSILVNKSID